MLKIATNMFIFMLTLIMLGDYCATEDKCQVQIDKSAWILTSALMLVFGAATLLSAINYGKANK